MISIIIPTFERPELLEKSVDSVLNQTYKNLEIIIVDDNFSNSIYRQQTELKFSNHIDKRVKYIKHENNKGANAARNTGFRYSSGDYIAFLDDDDEYMENKIEIQLNVALKINNDRGVLIFVGAEIIKEKISSFSNWMKNKFDTIVFENNEIFVGNFIGSNSFVFIDRKSFKRINGFDENLPSCQDWDLWIRLAESNIQLIGIPIPLVKYYDRTEINRITTDSTKKVEGHLKILNKHKEYLLKQNSETIILFYRYLYYQFLPIDIFNAIKILNLQFFHTKTFKNYLLIVVDIAMLLVVKVPFLYRFAQKIKHLK